MQTQNYRIIQMNKMIKALYSDLSTGFKKDMGQYAKLYKIRYPHLRKRGMSSYAVFLMVTYALVRRFGLGNRSIDEMRDVLLHMIMRLSIADCIRMKLLAVVNAYYVLNRIAKIDVGMITEFREMKQEPSVIMDFPSMKIEISLRSG